LVLLLLVSLLTGCATTAQHGALVRAYDAFNAGAYREALGHAARAETYEASNPTAKAEALLLKGRCHEALNERTEAIAAYQIVVRDHGSTAFAAKAKARLAELQR
jgi:tetratricopeptide (TPR) repeat protein